MTVSERVARARRRLAWAGIPQAEADLDARLLAQHVLGWDAPRFFADMQEPSPAGFDPSFEALIERRERREPMAYLLGHQEFWNLTIEVSRAVLIPRPETEAIIEAGLALLQDRNAAWSMADVCTGSGCLAVVLATEFPHASIVATDLSGEALAVAARNAERHQVADRIRFLHSHLLRAATEPFDLIVANPPYVREEDRLNLQPEVRDYEPGLALFSGRDGLQAMEELVRQAPARLTADGWLVFEFGFGQESAVRALVDSTPGLVLVEIRPDLQGIPRTAVARRR